MHVWVSGVTDGGQLTVSESHSASSYATTVEMAQNVVAQAVAIVPLIDHDETNWFCNSNIGVCVCNRNEARPSV